MGQLNVFRFYFFIIISTSYLKMKEGEINENNKTTDAYW